MLVLLPTTALLALWLALVSRGLPWRRAVVQTLLAGGLWVWALTEGLSQFALLGQPALAAGWAMALVASALAIDREALPTRFRFERRPRPDTLLLAATGAVIAFSAGAAFLSAVFGSPNAVDVLQYHLPRVVFWLQNGSVEFFPANYYQQLSLQPMAEYAMAHAFALTGGDRFVQLIPWAAFVGSICGVAWLASLLGAGLRGQALAAALAAAAPNAMLQASGAKNDLVQAFFLISAAAFAFETVRSNSRNDAAWAGAAAGLALLTKGTAYVFAPGLAAGVLLAVSADGRRALIRYAAAIVLIAFALNAPHYYRNYAYNGHPLGDGTATETPEGRYANERIDAGVVLSGILRNAVLQFAQFQGLTEELYGRVWTVHQWFGLDPNDRATTFGITMFEPPERELLERHDEVLAPSLLHTLLLAPLALWLLWRRRLDPVAAFSLGILLAFVLFCALIKWQPWHVRMHTPLQLLACAPIGMMLARLRRPLALIPVAAATLYLLIPAALYNGKRPLMGAKNVFVTDRFEQYFVSLVDSPVKHRQAADFILQGDCRQVAVDALRQFAQYPLLIALLQGDPSIRLRSSGLQNASAQLRPPGWFEDPCAVACLECGTEDFAWLLYGPVGTPTLFGDLAVFSEANLNRADLGVEAFDAEWRLDRNGDFTFDAGREAVRWGEADHVLVVGDWDGDGKDEVGSVDQAQAVWFRDFNGDFQLDLPEEAQAWGPKGAIPVVGDWDGDGKDDLGSFHNGVWYLDRNGNSAFDPQTEQRNWGDTDSMPRVGDWNGDGKDEVAVIDSATMIWFLDLQDRQSLDSSNGQKWWGLAGDTPVSGDWNGDGAEDLGLFGDGVWFLDLNGDSEFDLATEQIYWGPPGSIPLRGDWNGDDRDDLAAIERSTAAWFLDRDGDGVFDVDTDVYLWGAIGDRPIAGDWNGDGKDDIGVIVGAGR